jgi:hypothetical protein
MAIHPTSPHLTTNEAHLAPAPMRLSARGRPPLHLLVSHRVCLSHCVCSSRVGGGGSIMLLSTRIPFGAFYLCTIVKDQSYLCAIEF